MGHNWLVCILYLCHATLHLGRRSLFQEHCVTEKAGTALHRKRGVSKVYFNMYITLFQIHLMEFGSVWMTAPRKEYSVGWTVLTWLTLSGLPVHFTTRMVTTAAWEWWSIRGNGTIRPVKMYSLLFVQRKPKFSVNSNWSLGKQGFNLSNDNQQCKVMQFHPLV